MHKLLPLILLPLLAGCASFGTTTDKLEIERTFLDTGREPLEYEDGTIEWVERRTEITTRIKGGAGDVAAQDQSLDWKWNKDGSGHITTKSTQGSDSTGRATLIQAQTESNARLIESLAGNVGSLIQAIAPVFLPSPSPTAEPSSSPTAAPDGQLDLQEFILMITGAVKSIQGRLGQLEGTTLLGE